MKQGTQSVSSGSALPVPWWVRLRCFLFGHVLKDYCEPVAHYEIRCRRCGGIDTWIGPGKDPRR
jgi:hypothetical protein